LIKEIKDKPSSNISLFLKEEEEPVNFFEHLSSFPSLHLGPNTHIVVMPRPQGMASRHHTMPYIGQVANTLVELRVLHTFRVGQPPVLYWLAVAPQPYLARRRVAATTLWATRAPRSVGNKRIHEGDKRKEEKDFFCH
jgi:hypothetical protein